MAKFENHTLFAASDSPLSVTFLVLPGSSLMSVACAIDPLRAANRVTGRAAFTWTVVSPDGIPPGTTAGLSLPVDGGFDPDARTDLLVVVAGFGAHDIRDRHLLAAIYRVATRCGSVCGIETGAWPLARAGILDGRSATTHWEDLADFEMAFPSINTLPDRYVIDGSLMTSGGASPTFDMMTELVRRRLGPVVAIDVSSVFIHDVWHSAGDAQPHVSLGSGDQHDPRLIGAIRIMEDRIDRPVTIAAIANRLGLSTRTLESVFRKGVGQTPGGYFLQLRLNAGRRLVKNSRIPFADIAERSGFSSAATFSRAYRRAFGENPSTARQNG